MHGEVWNDRRLEKVTLCSPTGLVLWCGFCLVDDPRCTMGPVLEAGGIATQVPPKPVSTP
jgi:hypothetical protein